MMDDADVFIKKVLLYQRSATLILLFSASVSKLESNGVAVDAMGETIWRSPNHLGMCRDIQKISENELLVQYDGGQEIIYHVSEESVKIYSDKN